MNDDCNSDTATLKKRKSQKQIEATRRWREENKERVLAYSREYHLQNRTKQLERQRKWREANKEKRRAYAKKYEEENKEIAKERAQVYREQNKEKMNEACRRYYAENKERRLEHRKKYREANKEKIKAQVTRYRQENKQKLTEYQRLRASEKRKTDPVFMLSRALRNRIRNAVFSKGVRKMARSMELIGCTPTFLRQYLEARFSRGMSWENYGLDVWHIDHIVPCASFNLANEEEQKKCFHYSNLRPAWAKDNLRKSHKIITCQPELLISLA